MTGLLCRRLQLPSVLLFTAACMAPPPPAPRQALGCFSVHPSAWSTTAVHVTGIRQLPASIVLDSSFTTSGARRVWLPKNTPGVVAEWSTDLYEWRRFDDSIVPWPSRDAFHTLANDSITVTWGGWGGRLTAYLAPTATGYAGLAQLSPRQLANGASGIIVTLERVLCPQTL